MTIKIGNVEKAFGVLLVLSIGLSLLGAPGGYQTLANLAVYILGVWSFFRICRAAMRNAIWRLRNRLIVAYLFIGLVPVVLIVALVSLGGYLVGGQLSSFLVSSELDRRTTTLRSIAEFILANPGDRYDWSRTVGSTLQSRYPGLTIVATDPTPWTFPSGVQASPPPKQWVDTTGLVEKGGVLYAWAHVKKGEASTTAMFPITDDYVGTLASGLGRIDIVDLSGRVNGRNNLLRQSQQEASGSPSTNLIPPSVNAMDWQVHWPSPVQIAIWDKPGQFLENSTMIVSTRPSAVLRTVMPQRLELIEGFIPALFLSVAILFFIAEMISLVIGISLTRTITGAVHDLYQGTVRVMKGEFGHQIPVHGKDQLGELVHSFNRMSENLHRLVQIEKERERLQNELEIAREVQNQLFPKAVPKLERLRITAACRPARMVSGDYYDYQKVQKDSAAIAMGDVAGKGISAALLMATVQSSFRTELRGAIEISSAVEQGEAPGEISTAGLVSHLNQQIFNFTAPEKFTTFFFGLWDENSRTLTYTNAGHLPPILIHEGEVSRLEVNGMVVGAFPFAKFGSSQIHMAPGDLMVFFTDGISEPENEYGEDFGEERLVDMLVKNVDLPEDKLVELVMQAATQWSGQTELQDDMTLVMIRSL